MVIKLLSRCQNRTSKKMDKKRSLHLKKITGISALTLTDKFALALSWYRNYTLFINTVLILTLKSVILLVQIQLSPTLSLYLSLSLSFSLSVSISLSLTLSLSLSLSHALYPSPPLCYNIPYSSSINPE